MQTKKLICLVLIAWLILAVVFAFYDLQISRYLANPHSRWGEFIKGYGDIPGYIIFLIAVYILGANRKPCSTKVKEYAMAGMVVVITGFVTYSIGGVILYKFFPKFLEKVGFSSLPLAIALVIPLQILLKQQCSGWCRKKDRFARVTLYVGLLSLVLFVQGFKALWGRVRFVHLNPDYSNFTPWYLPYQGANPGDSFPSGHAALAWLLLPLLFLVLTSSRKVKFLTLTALVGWGILVSLGRVVMGEHYASDVLFSSGFTILCFLFWYGGEQISSPFQ
jgi:membrane-associated phospholipid phosphatase